jgi:6-pyruvoyltetrahydropterin/6-carboxytetrahydropterin synthase
MKAIRYHDISCGHRVVGHEGKCRNLHGHNYRFHFECEAAELDEIGRVIDFSVIKSQLCEWLETEWDHRMILWDQDSDAPQLVTIDPTIVLVPFNPTAENLAQYLIDKIGPKLMNPLGVRLAKVVIEETRKCSVSCEAVKL